MPNRTIAYSLVRLLSASLSPTPRGIDRIDMGILSNLFENWPGECFGVAPTLVGPRLFSRERVLRGRDLLFSLWHENDNPDEDPSFGELEMRLSRGRLAGSARPAPSRAGKLQGLSRALKLMLGEGVEFGLPLSVLPKASLYLDMGHDGLTFPTMTRWLDRRRDIAPVFLIHDLIPVLHSAFEKPETVSRHREALANAQRLARQIIVPTRAVARELTSYFEENCGLLPPVVPCPLPVNDVFLKPQTNAATWAERDYYVMCGTIEPRKNQALLMAVWRELLMRHGRNAPTLILAGARGAGAALLDGVLAESPLMAEKVIICAGLRSASIARLIAHSRALLMPSLAEGFGLPPLEALALGAVAVVSDIPAHRDAAGEDGIYLPPQDISAWVQTIEALSFDLTARAAAKQRIKNHQPRNWTDYFRALSHILEQVP